MERQAFIERKCNEPDKNHHKRKRNLRRCGKIHCFNGTGQHGNCACFCGSYCVRSCYHRPCNIVGTYVYPFNRYPDKKTFGDFKQDCPRRFSQAKKIEYKYDDEIGDLCDAISDMALDLQTADQMKNDFISRVSHELRTPLTAIKGWAETMQLSERGKLDRKTFDRGMGVIISESSRLTSIVEELLDFSRIQSGRMKLIKEKLDILAEFDDAVYFLKERAVTEGKHLLYDEPEVVYPAVYGDKNRLKQVFLNVLDNALKYTPKGGVVAAQVIYSKDEPDIIKIVITDTGCGISAEDLPKVKEKFYKANQTVGGSGIGLAVADEIMNLHNGSLDIESGEGVGTTVTLTFPVYKEGSENSLPENIKL